MRTRQKNIFRLKARVNCIQVLTDFDPKATSRVNVVDADKNSNNYKWSLFVTKA